MLVYVCAQNTLFFYLLVWNQSMRKWVNLSNLTVRRKQPGRGVAQSIEKKNLKKVRSLCWSFGVTFNLLTAVYVTSFEPWHELSNNVVCATSKASDQPAHMHSLIRAFASRLKIILEFLSLRGVCTGSSESTMFEITCGGSFVQFYMYLCNEMQLWW